MRHFSSPEFLQKQRDRARRRREKQGHPPTVFYFHQVDDPYSHLAIQKLDLLRDRYDLAFQPYLVSKPDPQYQGNSDHFEHWGLRDAVSVAADYGTHFSPSITSISTDRLREANQILACGLQRDDFAKTAFEVGTSLWQNEPLAPSAHTNEGKEAIHAGNAQRAELGHFQGAMFYFDGEWFWGIDRLRHLEQRLHAEGFDSDRKASLCVPEPTPEPLPAANNMDGVLLEYFPSLRSPYTAIGHQRVLDFVNRSGVKTTVRPVMPMLMRGIPAPREKQRYIITDAGRESREHGVPFGRIVDPFGEPVKRAFALFPSADASGHGMAFVTAYLNAAWFDGIDITNDKGLRLVVENSGLDWLATKQAAKDIKWQSLLSSNLDALTEEHLWGVPSFRVSGGNIEKPYACWGQDRIWRVASEISRRAR